MRRLGACARVLGAAVVLAACGWLAGGGCATGGDAVVREHDWKAFAPDGGWRAYVPEHGGYQPDTMEAATGQSRVSPFGLSGTDVH